MGDILALVSGWFAASRVFTFHYLFFRLGRVGSQGSFRRMEIYVKKTTPIADAPSASSNTQKHYEEKLEKECSNILTIRQEKKTFGKLHGLVSAIPIL